MSSDSEYEERVDKLVERIRSSIDDEIDNVYEELDDPDGTLEADWEQIKTDAMLAVIDELKDEWR